MSRTTDLILFLGGIGIWMSGLAVISIGGSPWNMPLHFIGALMATFGGINLIRAWRRRK